MKHAGAAAARNGKQKPVAHMNAESQAAAADHAAAAPQHKQQQQQQPVLAKAAAAGTAVGQGPTVPHAAAGAAGTMGSKSGASRTDSLKRHGSTTSRRLQALLASEELSSLSVLGAEGSELPGRSPTGYACCSPAAAGPCMQAPVLASCWG